MQQRPAWPAQGPIFKNKDENLEPGPVPGDVADTWPSLPWVPILPMAGIAQRPSGDAVLFLAGSQGYTLMTNVSVLTGSLLPSGLCLYSENQVKALLRVIKCDPKPFTWAKEVSYG